MTESTKPSLVQRSTFRFDNREIDVRISFILNGNHPDAVVKILDQQLNEEFVNDEISFRWYDHQVLVKPLADNVRLQAIIDAIAAMLVIEYSGNIAKVV